MILDIIFPLLSASGRKIFLPNHIQIHLKESIRSEYISKFRAREEKYIFGIKCCLPAIADWYGVSKWTVNRWPKRKTIIDGRRKKVYTNPKTNWTVEWMNHYLNRYAEFHPANNRRYLGSMHTRNFMYEMYLSSIKSVKTIVSVSPGHFYKVFETFFPDVTIYKWTPFTKCTCCVTVKDIKSRGPGKAVSNLIKIVRDEHILHVR